MPDEILLNEAAYAVWQTVKDRGPIELGEVVKHTGIDQAQVSAAATEAPQRRLLQIEEREREELVKSAAMTDRIRSRTSGTSGSASTSRESADNCRCRISSHGQSATDVAANEVLKWGASSRVD